MTEGVSAAVGAAMLYSLASVVQKTQAERVATTGIAILRPLLARPLWLFGIALQTLGFGLHSFALTRAPVVLVQPIIACGLVFLVIFAAWILRERPTARELAGMALAVVGVSLLAARIEGPDAMHPVAVQDLGLAIVSAAALIGALLYAGASSGSSAVRAASIGSAAGVGQGMSDAMNRLAGAWLSPQAGWIPPAAMGFVALLFLLLFGLLGLVTAQNGFQRHRANTVVPCMVTAQLLVPIAMAVALYGQSLPGEGVEGIVWGASLLLICAGITLLARASAVERAYGTAPHARADRPPS